LGDVASVLEPTFGIDILEADIETVGHVTFHDVSGLDAFHITYAFLFGGEPALFEYVVDTNLSVHDMLADAMYWLALILSCRSPDGQPVHVMILGNNKGGDKYQKVRQLKLDRVTGQLMQTFKGRFIFLSGDKSLVADMRQADSKEMKEVKKQLAIGIQKCLEHFTFPMVCQQVQARILSPLREEKAAQSSGQPSAVDQLINKSDFHALVLALKDFDFLKDSVMYSFLISCLQEWGEIVDIGNRFVIDTVWLCHSLLAATLVSKADQLQTRMNAGPDGTATMDNIIAALKASRLLNRTPAVDPRVGIDILCRMGLAVPIARNDVYRFPVLIQDAKPEGMWMNTFRNMKYVGIRLQCQSAFEILFPAFMPFLQTEVANQHGEMNVTMWKGGMVVKPIREEFLGEVEALIVISNDGRAIRALDLICRGPDWLFHDMKKFLNETELLTYCILNRKSPGTPLEKVYLSHRQIEDVAGVPSYGEDPDISLLQSVAERASRSEVIEAIVKHGSDQWYQIGRSLGLTRATVMSATGQIPTTDFPSKLRKVIWRKREQVGDDDLKRSLVEACVWIDDPIDIAVWEELRKLNESRYK
jgi:hypothetical protein